MRILLFLILLLVLVAGCSSISPGKAQRIEDNPKADLVFVGTIEKIEISPLEHSLANWAVTFQVEKVLRGDFDGKISSFRVHSPSLSGLEVGKKYTVAAEKTESGYTINQHQWRREKIQNRQ